MSVDDRLIPYRIRILTDAVEDAQRRAASNPTCKDYVEQQLAKIAKWQSEIDSLTKTETAK